MAGTGITFEQTKEACDKIFARGANVTLAAVRSELGTGSNSTITKHVRQWRELYRDQAKTSLSDLGISENLIIALQAEIGQHVSSAKREQDEVLAELKDEANETTNALEKSELKIESLQAQLESQREKYTQTIQDLEKKLAVAEAKEEQQYLAMENLTVQVDNEQQKTNEAGKKLAVTLSQNATLSKQLVEKSDIVNELKQAISQMRNESQSEIKELTKTNTANEKAAAVAESQVVSLKASIADLKEQLKELKATNQDYKKEIISLRKELKG